MKKNTSPGPISSDTSDRELLPSDILRALELDSSSGLKDSISSKNSSRFPQAGGFEEPDQNQFFTDINTYMRKKSHSHKTPDKPKYDFNSGRMQNNQSTYQASPSQNAFYSQGPFLPPGELPKSQAFFYQEPNYQKTTDDVSKFFTPYQPDPNFSYRKNEPVSQLPVFSTFSTGYSGEDSGPSRDFSSRIGSEYTLFGPNKASRPTKEPLDFNTGGFFAPLPKNDSPDLYFPSFTKSPSPNPSSSSKKNMDDDIFQDIDKFVSSPDESLRIESNNSDKVEKADKSDKPKPKATLEVPEANPSQTANGKANAAQPQMRTKSNSACSPSKPKSKKNTSTTSTTESTIESDRQNNSPSVQGYNKDFSSPGKSDFGEKIEYRIKSSSVTTQPQQLSNQKNSSTQQATSANSDASTLSITEDAAISAIGSNLSTPKSKTNVSTSSPGMDSAHKQSNSSSPLKEKGAKKEEPADAPTNRKPSNSVVGPSSSEPKNGQSRARRKTADNEEDKQYKLVLDKIEGDGRTTLMIKNIPNKYDLNLILQAIDKNHKGEYDFFYLPIDFRNKCNVGYAFINFSETVFIKSFYLEFHDKKWEKFNSEKICEIRYARIQGLESLKEHFQYSSVMSQQDKKLKPYIPSEGVATNGDEEKVVEVKSDNTDKTE